MGYAVHARSVGKRLASSPGSFGVSFESKLGTGRATTRRNLAGLTRKESGPAKGRVTKIEGYVRAKSTRAQDASSAVSTAACVAGAPDVSIAGIGLSNAN